MNKFWSLIDRVNQRISLWNLLAGGGVAGSGIVSAWAASATHWMEKYGPIGWYISALGGALISAVLLFVASLSYKAFSQTRAMNEWKRHVDTINPLDNYFYSKRVFLRDLLPPGSAAVENKNFHNCEIVGPLNVIPFNTNIVRCVYVTCDYVMISREKLAKGAIFNATIFRNCTFDQCRFFNVSFLVNNEEFDLFNSRGGCNWITLVPGEAVQPSLIAPPTSSTS